MLEVHAVAGADLDHASGQAGQCAVAVVGGAAALRFGADLFVHPREPWVLESRQISHGFGLHSFSGGSVG
jgi:hypothetical protein